MRLLRFLLAALIALAPVPSAFAQQAYVGVEQRPSGGGGPVIFDNMDRPDGTTITGTTLTSGNAAWTNIGPGTFFASDGEGTNGPAGCSPQPSCSNTYSDFPNTSVLGGTPQPITHQWAAFRVKSLGMPFAIIADMCSTSCPTFINFVHLNVGRTGWALTYCVTGSCAPGFNLLGTGLFNGPLIIGSVYGAAIDFDYSVSKVRAHLPDGTVTSWYSIPSSLVPVYNRFQIGGFSAPLSGTYLAVGSGQSKAEAIVGAGFGAPMAEINRLNLLFNEIGGQKVITPGATVAFATFQTSSAQSGNRLIIQTDSTVMSSILPGVATDSEDFELPILSTGCCITMGPYNPPTHSNQQNGSGVCVSNALSAAITSGTPGSPYTITLYITPVVYCANSGYINNVRFNYTVLAKGDPGGTLTPQ